MVADQRQKLLGTRQAVLYGSEEIPWSCQDLLVLGLTFQTFGFDQLAIGCDALGVGLAQPQPRFRGIEALVLLDPRIVPIAAEVVVLRPGPLRAVPAIEREVGL